MKSYKEVFGTVLLLLFNGVFFACNYSNSDPVLKEFKKKAVLKSVVTKINSDDIGEHVDMLLIDSVLIINEMSNEYIYRLFNINNGNLIKNCIKRGSGPNEMIFPRAISYYKDDLFTSYSNSRNELLYFSLNDLLNGDDHFYRSQEIDMQTSFRGYPINDSLIICTGMYEKGRYGLYDIKNKDGSVKYDYPSDQKHEEESDLLKGMVFQGEITMHPNRNMFAHASLAACELEIFSIGKNDFERDFQKVYFLPNYTVRDNRYKLDKSNKLGFMSMISTDSFLCVLYSGRSTKEFGMECFSSNALLIYDWSGNPIIHFELDRQIKDITIDNENMIIYAYSINQYSGEPEIISYELPNF
ncbi:MAG: hypothetical protein JEZ14_22845 [Marinilabiliaceae bacterium]|nr:hypothetical protein [Marinilabiliaceae bacterium]